MPAAPIERLPQLYRRPGFLVRRAHQIFEAIFEDNFIKLALSPAQYSVLLAVHNARGINQNDIARSVGMNKVTVSQIVQALEERGWIARETAPADRRRRHLALTAAGRRALARTAAMADATYDQQMAPLEPHERETLVALLQRVVDTLEPRARTPFAPLGGTGDAEA